MRREAPLWIDPKRRFTPHSKALRALFSCRALPPLAGLLHVHRPAGARPPSLDSSIVPSAVALGSPRNETNPGATAPGTDATATPPERCYCATDEASVACVPVFGVSCRRNASACHTSHSISRTRSSCTAFFAPLSPYTSAAGLAILVLLSKRHALDSAGRLRLVPESRLPP